MFRLLTGRGVLHCVPTVFILLYVFSSPTFGETQVLFSPRGSIRDHILENMRDCSSSLEIAIYEFTSGDIAEALVAAANRGIRIGIVMDKKQAEKEGSLYDFLKDEGFDVHLVKGRVGGSMHNSFVIFDNRLVLTGSYEWTEYAEKFNYENVIITDEKPIVEMYRQEFLKLYEGSGAVAAGTPQEELTTKSTLPAPIKIVPQVQEVKAKEEEQVAEKELAEEPLLTSSRPDSSEMEFINITFEELDKIFGYDSALSRAEKKKEWEKYQGKYVRWTGEVGYRGIGRSDWNRMGIKQTDKVDIELRFGYRMMNKVLNIEEGQIITYTGMLYSRRGFSSPYRLRNAWIEEIHPAKEQQQGEGRSGGG